MKEAKQKQLVNFLMQRGLTLKEFKVIKSICAEMAELEGQLKDERKKGKLGEQLEDTEHSMQKDT